MKTLTVYFTMMTSLRGADDIVNIEVTDAAAKDLLRKPIPDEASFTMNFHYLCAILRHISRLRGYNGRNLKPKILRIEEKT